MGSAEHSGQSLGEVLAECRRLGLTVRLDGDRASVTPAALVPAHILAALRENRQWLKNWICNEPGCTADVHAYAADGNGYCQAHIYGSVRIEGAADARPALRGK